MDYPSIFLFVVLFLLSWFFSGSEIALISLPKHKIDFFVKNKKVWSKSLKSVRENTDRLLILILIWNNLVNTYTAALATQIAMSSASKMWIPEAQAVVISTALVTIFLLLFWEIIPKSIASKNTAIMALLVAPVYNFLMIVLYPLIVFIEIIIKIFSGKKKAETITWEEIQSFLDMWRANWWIDEDEHEKLKSIFEFSDTIVEEIMTPRVKIEAIPNTFTIKQAVDFYLLHTHTRIPIYNWTIDKIDYFISSRDLIREFSNGNWDKKISDLKMRKVLKVPLNQPISKLLNIFQNTNKSFAIIMDQYGWVAWLVSLEDIVEQVFGEIRDESDKESEEFLKTEDWKIICDSLVLMQDLLDEFELDLEEIWLDEKEFNWETVSYIITDVLENFPTVWQEIKFVLNSENKEDSTEELILKVLETEEAKIWKIEARIEILETEEEKKD